MNRSIPGAVAFLPTVVLTIALAGCGSKHESEKENPPHLPAVSVRMQTVQSRPHAIIDEVVGTVRAKRQATIEARVSGQIVKLPVVLGQRVNAGERVARLEAAEIHARLEQAEAASEHAERDWKRASALFEQQAVTRAEYEAAESRNRVAKGVVAEAKAMVSYVQIAAPFDGIVTKKWADVGDFASPGKPLIAIEDPSVLQLEADVPQAIASHVQREAHLRAHVDGVSGELTGIVSEIGPAADPVTRTFPVKVDLVAQPGLSSGQFGRLLLPVGESHSLRVPVSAVVLRGQLEMVFIVVNEHAQMQLVETGKHIGYEMEILSGLHASDVVAVEGAAQLTDGQPVVEK